MRVIKSLVAVAVALIAVQAFAQDACTNGEAQAIETVRKTANPPLALEAARLFDPSDYLMFLANVKIHQETEAVGIRFYKVVETPYWTDCRTLEKQASVIGDAHAFQWVVAVNSKGVAYIVAGTNEEGKDNENFNRLIKDNFQFRITDARQALDIFYLYLDTVLEDRHDSLVVDDLWLQIVALKDFHSRYGPEEGQRQFQDWWSKLPARGKKLITEPTAKPIQGGFEVTYFMYFPVMAARVKLIVHDDGTVARVVPTNPGASRDTK